MSPSREPSSESGGKLSIGALSRATGIPIETLRTWEARYGYPVPERKPSGHRVYLLTSIPRLRRIAEALARGHRAGDVVTASDQTLTDLLAATSVTAAVARPTTGMVPGGPSDLLHAIQAFDAAGLTRTLLQDWARLGPLDFLNTRIAPAIREVGDAWEGGRLEIRHEHFFSEKVGDLLRSLRLPFEERAHGPLVVCSSLPGESARPRPPDGDPGAFHRRLPHLVLGYRSPGRADCLSRQRPQRPGGGRQRLPGLARSGHDRPDLQLAAVGATPRRSGRWRGRCAPASARHSRDPGSRRAGYLGTALGRSGLNDTEGRRR